MFRTRLEPLRVFVSSYPMDGILRISENCSRPINEILSDETSAFTDQPRLCCRKHRSLQHHPCFRAMTNLQPRIRRPRCYRSGATGTPVDPTTDRKRKDLIVEKMANIRYGFGREYLLGFYGEHNAGTPIRCIGVPDKERSAAARTYICEKGLCEDSLPAAYTPSIGVQRGRKCLVSGPCGEVRL